MRRAIVPVLLSLFLTVSLSAQTAPAVRESGIRAQLAGSDLVVPFPSAAQSGASFRPDSAAGLALARKGNATALQRLACMTQTGSTDDQFRLLRDDLPQVGGAFAIRVYLRLLDSEEEVTALYMKEHEHEDAGDLSFGGIAGPARVGLLHLLPERPSDREIEIADDGQPRDYRQRNEFVRTWVLEHESGWKHLEPQGGGIDYSGRSCPLPKPCEATSDTERLVCGIKQGHIPSIVAAGRSGNTVFVPYLRKHVANHKVDPRDGVTGYIAQEALGRLDDTKTLQALVCEASGDFRTQSILAYFKLRGIGGAFAVRMYQRLLGEDASYRAAAMKAGESPGYVSGIAAVGLAGIIPKAPARYLQGASDRDALVAFWKDWLREHESEWIRLRPTGEGVDYSGASCRRGK